MVSSASECICAARSGPRQVVFTEFCKKCPEHVFFSMPRAFSPGFRAFSRWIWLGICIANQQGRTSR